LVISPTNFRSKESAGKKNVLMAYSPEKNARRERHGWHFYQEAAEPHDVRRAFYGTA
jgi:hypothetical protein